MGVLQACSVEAVAVYGNRYVGGRKLKHKLVNIYFRYLVGGLSMHLKLSATEP